VMSGFSPGRVRRPAALALPFLLSVLSGCGSTEADPYPTDLKYLPRTDPLVVKSPEAEPWNPDGPGQLEQAVARIGVPQDKGGIGGQALDPRTLPADVRGELEKELGKVFNTPRKPHLELAEDSSANKYKDPLQLSWATMAKGSVLYRRHCLHCHGLNGDGRGPTGPWLNPHPRDYRRGQFKFISTNVSVKNRKPRREDLLRTLRQGVEGTSMPSFGLQTDEELNQIVSYVIHLSIRGEVEFDTLQTLIAKEDLEGGSIATHVQDRVEKVLTAWGKSDSANEPPAYKYKDDQLADSIRRGYDLFANQKNPKTSGACIKCHADFGRQVPYKYDLWGTLVRPANLTVGIYRGGRRPLDIYWRIKGGIPPSAMPEAPPMDPDDYWDLVNFVQTLPYRNMLQKLTPEVYDKIYGEKSHGATAAAPPARAAAE
jgi:mono/diheme cytochrome c family protein